MDYSCVKEMFDGELEMPHMIEKALVELFGVDDIAKYPMWILQSKVSKLYHDDVNIKTNYADSYKEYALYYMPINFYKIWQVLIDLVEQSSCGIQPNIKALDLGAGPGTSTFGLIEFYRVLASHNADIDFSLDITVLEKEQGFLDILDEIYSKYTTCFPDNLRVNIMKVRANLNDRISFSEKFDIIMESNVLNCKERTYNLACDNIARLSQQNLVSGGVLVLIEPYAYGRDINYEQNEQKTSKLCYTIQNVCGTDGQFELFDPHICFSRDKVRHCSVRVTSRILTQLKKYEKFKNIRDRQDFRYCALMKNDYHIAREWIFGNLASSVGKRVNIEGEVDKMNDRVAVTDELARILSSDDMSSLRLVKEEDRALWLHMYPKYLTNQMRNMAGKRVQLKDVLVLEYMYGEKARYMLLYDARSSTTIVER